MPARRAGCIGSARTRSGATCSRACWWAGRISLAVGVVATAVALCIGVVYGTVSGYYGGNVDALMMRIVDIIYALPFTIFVILLSVFFNNDQTRDRINRVLHSVFGPNVSLGSEFNIILLFAAIGAVEWLTMARIVRGQVRSLRRMDFVEAATALGIRPQRIIFRHLIPNVLGPIIVYTTLTIPSVMLLEAFLSFLGLGIQPPNASWGVLIGEGAKEHGGISLAADLSRFRAVDHAVFIQLPGRRPA